MTDDDTDARDEPETDEANEKETTPAAVITGTLAALALVRRQRRRR